MSAVEFLPKDQVPYRIAGVRIKQENERERERVSARKFCKIYVL